MLKILMVVATMLSPYSYRNPLPEVKVSDYCKDKYVNWEDVADQRRVCNAWVDINLRGNLWKLYTHV